MMGSRTLNVWRRGAAGLIPAPTPRTDKNMMICKTVMIKSGTNEMQFIKHGQNSMVVPKLMCAAYRQNNQQLLLFTMYLSLSGRLTSGHNSAQPGLAA